VVQAFEGNLEATTLAGSTTTEPPPGSTIRKAVSSAACIRRPAGVLNSKERCEQLLAAEQDAGDVSAFDAAMSEEGPNSPRGSHGYRLSSKTDPAQSSSKPRTFGNRVELRKQGSRPITPATAP